MATDFLSWRREHDPNGQTQFGFPWLLRPGEAIITAVVDVVDPTSTTIDAATDLAISGVTFGQIQNTQYGVSFWVTGGTAGTDYTVRCRIETTLSPVSNKTDYTGVLRCRQL
jgi:hypothetical protein